MSGRGGSQDTGCTSLPGLRLTAGSLIQTTSLVIKKPNTQPVQVEKNVWAQATGPERPAIIVNTD